MKLSFLFSLLSMMCLFSYSQKFVVVPRGLVNADDTAKHYVVIRIDSLSARELYNRSLGFIDQNAKSQEMAKESKDGEWIRVKVYAKNAIVAKGSFGLKFNLDLRYRLHLDFKDGKVRYEITDLDMNNKSPYEDDGPFYIQSKSTLNRSIYNKDGALIEKEKAAKNQLENYFNNQITELKVTLIAPSSKTDF